MVPSEHSDVVVLKQERRWLRRSCWGGCGLAVAIVLFVVGHSLFVRWQLQQDGWEVGGRYFGFSGFPMWQREVAKFWIYSVEDVYLEDHPIQPRDLGLLRKFPKLKSIDLQRTTVSEVTATQFAQCLTLERLSLWDVDINDPSIAQIANCRSLRKVRLGNMPVNDESLIHLQKLNQLVALTLDETGSKGFQHITNCSSLETLEIYGGHLTDADLTSLTRLAKLRKLSLYECSVTDEGAKNLAGSALGLTELDLRGNPLTDAAMPYLARLPDLEYLVLGDQPITDDGLRELKACASLGRLVVKSTNVTSSGIDELKRANPKLRVFP